MKRPLPAALLSPEEVDRHAHALATHPVYLVRQIVMLLKLMAGVFWGESPEVRAFLHLPVYPADPGTRRVEPHVHDAPRLPRAPTEALVRLGRLEEERGRAHRAPRAGERVARWAPVGTSRSRRSRSPR